MSLKIQEVILSLYDEAKEAISEKSPEKFHHYIMKNCPEDLRYVKTKQPKDVFKTAVDKLVAELRAIQTWNEHSIQSST